VFILNICTCVNRHASKRLLHLVLCRGHRHSKSAESAEMASAVSMTSNICTSVSEMTQQWWLWSVTLLLHNYFNNNNHKWCIFPRPTLLIHILTKENNMKYMYNVRISSSPSNFMPMTCSTDRSIKKHIIFFLISYWLRPLKTYCVPVDWGDPLMARNLNSGISRFTAGDIICISFTIGIINMYSVVRRQSAGESAIKLT
jgi:hypothetical protein